MKINEKRKEKDRQNNRETFNPKCKKDNTTTTNKKKRNDKNVQIFIIKCSVKKTERKLENKKPSKKASREFLFEYAERGKIHLNNSQVKKKGNSSEHPHTHTLPYRCKNIVWFFL